VTSISHVFGMQPLSRLTKVIFCHSAQLLKNALPSEDPKPMLAVVLSECEV
jgi:hypothetical protein